jgi:hypothetical protein
LTSAPISKEIASQTRQKTAKFCVVVTKRSQYTRSNLIFYVSSPPEADKLRVGIGRKYDGKPKSPTMVKPEMLGYCRNFLFFSQIFPIFLVKF